jgi:hypothetical protein
MEGLRVSALSAAAAAAAAAQAMGTLDFPYFHVEQTTRLNLSRELLLGVMCAPPPRTKWTRRVPHPVLIGHAASLTCQCARASAGDAPPRTDWTYGTAGRPVAATKPLVQPGRSRLLCTGRAGPGAGSC